jgi:hypothetical protein
MKNLIREQGFGPFFFDGHEILRRIFITVRDARWRELAPTRLHCALDERLGLINIDADHHNEDVEFKWQGSLQLNPDERVVRFQFEGIALKTMHVCRLGLVVLHPVDAMRGATLTTRGRGGQQVLAVPDGIAPQQIIDGFPAGMTEPFSSMTLEHPHIGRLDLHFGGDEFELEDQRNWGDASFKTYCTPLRLGFPRTVEQGTRITQSLEARFLPAHPERTPRPIAPQVLNQPRPHDLKIGRMVPPSWQTLQTDGWMTGWDHLRVDLRSTGRNLKEGADVTGVDWAGTSDIERLLERLPGATMLEIGVPLEEGIEVSPEFTSLLDRYTQRVCALIVYDPKRPLPTASGIERLRTALRSTRAREIPVLASPTGYFVELNRGLRFDLDVDGIAFPLSSTVHAEDADTILENATAVSDMIHTARQLTGKDRVGISPLALYWPPVAGSSRFPEAIVAQWLVSVLAHASQAGATSLTVAPEVVSLGRLKDRFVGERRCSRA